MPIAERIADHIERCHLGSASAKLEMDTPLFDLNIIDSSGIYELVQFISDEFAVQIPFEQAIPSNFESVRSIAALVTRGRVAGAQP
jgi:peptidyl carrier protein